MGDHDQLVMQMGNGFEAGCCRPYETRPTLAAFLGPHSTATATSLLRHPSRFSSFISDSIRPSVPFSFAPVPVSGPSQAGGTHHASLQPTHSNPWFCPPPSPLAYTYAPTYRALVNRDLTNLFPNHIMSYRIHIFCTQLIRPRASTSPKTLAD